MTSSRVSFASVSISSQTLRRTVAALIDACTGGTACGVTILEHDECFGSDLRRRDLQHFAPFRTRERPYTFATCLVTGRCCCRERVAPLLAWNLRLHRVLPPCRRTTPRSTLSVATRAATLQL